MPGRLVGRRYGIGSAILTASAFIAALAVTLAASELLARGLTRFGTKTGMSEGLLGLLGALGADSPELSSAVIAIAAGAAGVGVGVVVGSNLFNLAALLGLSAVVAGGVDIRRAPLLFDAAVGVIVAAASWAMAAGLLTAVACALLVGPVIVVYVAILATPRRHLRRLDILLRSVPRGLMEIAYEVTHDRPTSTHGSWTPVILLPVAVVAVVGGSFVMVHAALDAQRELHVSDTFTGMIVLAALTSLPNLWIALHFARHARGTALFSSAMNSNSINLVGGLIVPAVIAGTSAASGALTSFEWLGLLTVLAILLPLPASRLSRVAGGLIIGVYITFVVQLVSR